MDICSRTLSIRMNLFFLWFGGVKLWRMLARTARTFQADEGILMLLLLLLLLLFAAV
jgi:hypothetical protein